MRTILLAAALAASADISFEIENFTAARGISKITLKVTNGASVTAGAVYIDCAFMDKDMKAIDIGHALVTNLAPGQTKYAQAAIAETAGVENATCYIDSVR